MRKLSVLLLFFLIGTNAVFSQSEIGQYPMEKSSLLWKVSGPETIVDSYIFGTMHLIEKDYFLFPNKLKKLIKKSDLVVMELDGIPPQEEIIKHITLSNRTFFDYFNDAQIDSILVWAKEKFHMDEAIFRNSFSTLKPFAVSQLALQLHFMGKTESYEMTIEELAHENEVPIKGLETIAEQMALFDNLDDEQQTEMLMSGVREGDRSVDLVLKMETTYVAQNVDELYQLIEDEGGIIVEEQDKFLKNRNTNWLPKIVNYINKQSTFIAVGAGHLGGPDGILRLLEKEGYTITPIQL